MRKPFYHRGLVALLILTLTACPAWAKSDPSQWGNLQKMKVGSGIVVKTEDGRRIEGTLNEITADSLSILDTSDRVTRLRKAEVREVRKGKMSRGKGTLLGLGLGAAIGTGVGAAIGKGVEAGTGGGGDDRGLLPALGALVGLGAGSVIGLGAGYSQSQGEGKLIYIAP